MVKDFPDIAVTRADGLYGKILHHPSLLPDRSQNGSGRQPSRRDRRQPMSGGNSSSPSLGKVVGLRSLYSSMSPGLVIDG